MPNISQSENDNSLPLPPETDYFDHKIDSKHFIDEFCDTFENGNETKLAISDYLNNLRNDINNWSETKVKLGNILGTKVKSKTKKARTILKKPWNKTITNRRQNRNKVRFQRFHRVQKSYAEDKSLTISQLLDDKFNFEDKPLVEPSIEEVEKVYISRLENNPNIDSSTITPGFTSNDQIVYGKITLEEVKNLIKDTKKDTASGTDNWKLEHVKSIGFENIQLIFNAWWAYGLPTTEKSCRTILLEKKGDLTDVNIWHPITIGNILIRLYCKIWDSRLRTKVQIHSRQKAFVPIDGCYENVKTLQSIIRQRNKSKKELNIVFLDLSKAFDTVLKITVMKALDRKGVPSDVKNLIDELYTDATTQISTSTKSTRQIFINSGVKQGCPLSPFLFNLIIDDLIEQLHTTKLGANIHDERIPIMGFADDLIRIEETSFGMDALLKSVRHFLTNEDSP